MTELRGGLTLLCIAAIACGSEAPHDPAEPDADGMHDAGEPQPRRADEPDGVDLVLSSIEGECNSTMPRHPYTIEVDAAGLDVPDGTTVHVFTEMRLASTDSPCGARASASVEGGRFEVAVQSLTDGAAYPRVVIWVDVDGDDQCEASSDLLHDQFWTALTHASRSFTDVDLTALPGSSACDPFGGDASDPEAADSDPRNRPTRSCLFVNPVEVPGATTRGDLHVSGRGLQELEGMKVRLLTLTREVAPLAIAEITIEAGAFELQIADALVDYTGVGLYVDLDGDGRCSTDEPMHEMTTGPATDDTVLELGRDQLAPADCLINGGVGDLSEPIPCPPTTD